jgi:Holliday junction resolvase RusA-like endonuclease
MTEPRSIVLDVRGIPRPGGSKKAFFRPGMKHPAIVEDCEKSKDWRQDVKAAALATWKGPLLSGALCVDVCFIMPRLKSHYGTGKNAGILKANAPTHHTTKPDRTKLLRSTEDALTGVLWRDDAAVCDGRLQKIYGEHPGATITVTKLNEEGA